MCLVEDCGYPSKYKRFQLCEAHRRQQRNGMSFQPARRRVSYDEPCTFEPCQEKRTTLKWCKTHYLQNYHGRPLRMTKRPVPALSRNENGNKWCSTCETWRPEADFASSKGKPDGLQRRCRPCNAAIYKARAVEIRDVMRQQRMNMSRGEFDAMFAAQGQACAICRTADPGNRFWCVDHDHGCCPEAGRSCGRCIRGILCSPCNTGIGALRDDVNILRSATEYLTRASLVAA